MKGFHPLLFFLFFGLWTPTTPATFSYPTIFQHITGQTLFNIFSTCLIGGLGGLVWGQRQTLKTEALRKSNKPKRAYVAKDDFGTFKTTTLPNTYTTITQLNQAYYTKKEVEEILVAHKNVLTQGLLDLKSFYTQQLQSFFTQLSQHWASTINFYPPGDKK